MSRRNSTNPGHHHQQNISSINSHANLNNMNYDFDISIPIHISSAKDRYRYLKKKFRLVVYENECYQEEIRNQQRKLLKLARDKNFLLDRLLYYEPVSDSSDEDSDATVDSEQELGGRSSSVPTNNSAMHSASSSNFSTPPLSQSSADSTNRFLNSIHTYTTSGGTAAMPPGCSGCLNGVVGASLNSSMMNNKAMISGGNGGGGVNVHRQQLQRGWSMTSDQQTTQQRPPPAKVSSRKRPATTTAADGINGGATKPPTRRRPPRPPGSGGSSSNSRRRKKVNETTVAAASTTSSSSSTSTIEQNINNILMMSAAAVSASNFGSGGSKVENESTRMQHIELTPNVFELFNPTAAAVVPPTTTTANNNPFSTDNSTTIPDMQFLQKQNSGVSSAK